MNTKRPQQSEDGAPLKRVLQGPKKRVDMDAATMSPVERVAPSKSSKKGDLRSRAVYSLEDAAFDESVHGQFGYNEDWDEQRNLVMPKARRGFVQRYVRVSMHGDTDTRNITRRMNQGWRPRPASSAPEMNSIMLGENDVIGDEENILMERPEWMADKQRAIKEQKRLDQFQEVERNIFGANPGGGFGQIHYDESSTKVRSGGRIAPVDDESTL